MPRTPVATSTRSLHEHLGRDMLALARPLLAQPVLTYADEIAFGRALAGMVKAAVKSAIEGRQSNAQVKQKQQKAQQAFARALARKARKV